MRKSGNLPTEKKSTHKEGRKPRDKKSFSKKSDHKTVEKKYKTSRDKDSEMTEKPAYRKKNDFEKKSYSGTSHASREKNYDENKKQSGKDFSDKRDYKKRDRKSFDEKPFSRKPKDAPADKKYGDSGKYSDKKFSEKRDYKKRDQRSFDEKPFSRKPKDAPADKKYGDRGKYSDKKFSEKRDYKKRDQRSFDEKPFSRKPKDAPADKKYGDSKFRKKGNEDRPSWSDNRAAGHESTSEKSFPSKNKRQRIPKHRTYEGKKREFRNPEIFVKDNTYEKRRSFRSLDETNGIRLNKFIANAGICSRREADTLIETGVITINGKIITQLGTKVMPGDVVKFNDQVLHSERHQYLLLNKPKGYLTTTDDPQERQTVMEIIKDACAERIYPVGRLDKNTSGLLLFTNDGELAKKLTHPSHQVEKVYKAELDKPLLKGDMEKIAEGIELEDGLIKVDAIAYGESKKEIGLELHSGKNRIVRRIFESLGYDVVKLDRVVFAGLTKKELPRGKYRFLSNEEVNILRRIR